MTPYEQQELQQLQRLNQNQQGYNSSPNGYNNVLNSYHGLSQPRAITVRLTDEDVQRIVQGVLDGMQERWGRRAEDT